MGIMGIMEERKGTSIPIPRVVEELEVQESLMHPDTLLTVILLIRTAVESRARE